tara:strand:+ start:53200 stop:53919 length:720 start_codon:yes stop_codon:yes gene_type:complete
MNNLILGDEEPFKLFKKGNQAMIDGNYNYAIEYYEAIIANGYENNDLYYNLGNAYFRINSIGLAQWAYSKALSISPRDGDILHNLAVTQARQIDRIKMPETFVLLKLYRNLKKYLSLKEFLFFGSVIFLFQSFFFLLHKTGNFNGIFYKYIMGFLFILVIVIHGTLADKYYQNKKYNFGVIIHNNVKAYSNPFNSNSLLLFQLNEGAFVQIDETQSNMYEILLIDGKKGWVPTDAVRNL